MNLFYDQLAALPHGAAAALVFILGCLAVFLANRAAVRLLQFARFNHLCDRAGISDFLRKGGIGFQPAEFAGRGLAAILLIGVLLETARLLDIAALRELRERLLAALPGLLAATLVLAAGLMVVAFIAGFIRTIVRNAGSPYADLWASLTRWTGTLLVLALALEQAAIQGSILSGVIQIIIAAFAFGAALAFGLGCKDLARDAMERLLAELKERHRDMTKSDLEG